MEGKILIGGTLRESVKGEWLNSIDPSTEEIIGRIPRGKAEDIDNAVESAKEAFPAWSALDPDERAAYIYKIANEVESRAEEIARLEVRDTGHTIKRVRGDSRGAAWTLRSYAGQCHELNGETISATTGNYHITVREPYGVVGRIMPFNHPIKMAASVGAPLVAGNTVVLKPPKDASLSVCLFAEICKDILPPGVLNIVTGSGSEAGEALARHPDVKRLCFTGSKSIGQRVQMVAAEKAIKNLTLELGGKNPMIIFPDADLKKALRSVLNGMSFAWSGQSCGSTSRLFLHDSIYDSSVEELGKLIGGLKVGNPLDEGSDMGPIIHKTQYEKVFYYIKAGQEDGARLITGGMRPEGEEFKKGYWVRPTMFADVTPKMRIFNEEIFGPVLSVIRWSDPEEVIKMANAVEYGLTASVWTENFHTAFRTVSRIRAGYIWLNGASTHFKGTPYGGMKNSGVGREEGIDDILSFTERKTIHVLFK